MSATQTFRVELPDIEYWQRQIKCQWGCPVRTDARGYVITIAEGRYFDAYKIARAPNPFASICGRASTNHMSNRCAQHSASRQSCFCIATCVTRRDEVWNSAATFCILALDIHSLKFHAARQRTLISSKPILRQTQRVVAEA